MKSYKGQSIGSLGGSSYHGAKTAAACLDPRKGLSNIGPGPVVPKGAPPPSSKGSVSMPKQVGR